MPLIPRLSSLWRNLFHKDRVDQEFSEESRHTWTCSRKRNSGKACRLKKLGVAHSSSLAESSKLKKE